MGARCGGEHGMLHARHAGWDGGRALPGAHGLPATPPRGALLPVCGVQEDLHSGAELGAGLCQDSHCTAQQVIYKPQVYNKCHVLLMAQW